MGTKINRYEGMKAAIEYLEKHKIPYGFKFTKPKQSPKDIAWICARLRRDD